MVVHRPTPTVQRMSVFKTDQSKPQQYFQIPPTSNYKFNSGASNSAEMTEVSSVELSSDQFLFRSQKSLLDQVTEIMTCNNTSVSKSELDNFAN